MLDPFAGGGTTLVEAMALGRNALGLDISSLAAFVCQAKTPILSDADVTAFERRRAGLGDAINMHAPSVRHDDYFDAGYYRNLGGRQFWRLRKAVEQALSSLEAIRPNGAQVSGQAAPFFARRSGRWTGPRQGPASRSSKRA